MLLSFCRGPKFCRHVVLIVLQLEASRKCFPWNLTAGTWKDAMAPKSYQKLSNLPIFSNDQFSGAMLVSASVTEGEPTKGYAWLSRGLSGAWHCLAVPLFFVVLVRGWKSTLEPKQYRSVLYSIFIETQVTSIVEGQPPQKAMSFPFKTRVIWVLGMFFLVWALSRSLPPAGNQSPWLCWECELRILLEQHLGS